MSESYSSFCNRVFEIFCELSKIPHGSGNMDGISKYCVDFANRLGLKCICDDAKNVVIYKDGNKCTENEPPVILQGHLDMVCQKTGDSSVDFLKDGIEVLRNGDILCANNTTLGADNGIAVAMVLSILERNDISHPPIEAVFTTDEEIGMLGAIALDTSVLSGKTLINIDSEEDDTVTVSCAGGSDLKASLSVKRIKRNLDGIKIVLGGLKGGHSGIEISGHRTNAAVLSGRLLQYLKEKEEVYIASVDSGDKANAIPNLCVLTLACPDASRLVCAVKECLETVKKEIAFSEADFNFEIELLGNAEYDVLSGDDADRLIYALCLVPNGIVEMSAEIDGLVETSLNLGILSSDPCNIDMQFALRSNKSTALKYLENRLKLFFKMLKADITTGGYYPPWELKRQSRITNLYSEAYIELFGNAPKIEAIHAGLECAVFSSAIEGVDCIAIGPSVRDAHTVYESLSISSTEKIYKCLLKVLKKLAEK